MSSELTYEQCVEVAPPRSLAEALERVPDPRQSQGRRHPLSALLTIAVCAMLCGARSLYAIAQWGRDHREGMAQALGFVRFPPPSVSTLHRVFKRLDVTRLEAVLGEWFATQGLPAGEGIALDGKWLRGIHGENVPGVHLVSAYAHHAGCVLAQKGGGE